MELDDFKKTGSKAFSVSPESMKKDEDLVTSVIERFREEDKKNRKKAIMWIVFLISFSVIYFSRIASETGIVSIGMLLLGCGMILVALYLWHYSRPIPGKSYSLPLVQFLDLADNKLKYMKKRDILIIIPILILLGLGGGLVFTGSLMKHSSNITLLVLIWFVFYLGLCIFGFWAGRKNWERDFGDLARSISGIRDILSK